MSRPMRALALAAALAALTLPPAHADEAADHHAAAVALLDVLHPGDAVNALMPNLINGLRLNLTHNDPDLVKEFDKMAPALAAEGEAAKPELIDRIVDIYAKTFSTEELQAIAAFYRSPVGAKMVATQAAVTTDTIAAVREWGTRLAQKLGEEARTTLQQRQP